MFPRIYENQTCPLPGYEAMTFRVLINPTGAEKTDWARGHLGRTDCADCQAARNGTGEQIFCVGCSLARDQMGRSSVAVYGQSQVAGFDFTTPAASLATFAQDDLPDELLAWLYLLPGSLWQARSDDLAKKLDSSSRTATGGS